MPRATRTDAPVLHGHIDGARGHDDRHRHYGGNERHGHPTKRDLGRVVNPDEYVGPDALANIEAAEGRTARLADDADDTQPASPTTSRELAVTGRTGDPDEFYARGIKIVRRADTLRFEAQVAVDCRSLLDEAVRLLDEAQDQQDVCQEVDEGIVAKLPDISRRLGSLFDGWALQRGLSGNGGAS